MIGFASFLSVKSSLPKFPTANRGSQRSKPNGTTRTASAGASKTCLPSRLPTARINASSKSANPYIAHCAFEATAASISASRRKARLSSWKPTPIQTSTATTSSPNPRRRPASPIPDSCNESLNSRSRPPTEAGPKFKRMTPRPLAVFCFSLVFVTNPGIYSPVSTAADDFKPRVFILHPDELFRARERIHSDDPALLSAFSRLKGDADRALGGATYSVLNKKLAPPSSDKHDYMSVAPYWWPNPNTPNGLPYVRRDGEVNPERDATSDRKRLDGLVQSVKTLGLSYFFTRREEYAAHAAKLLRVWFLDDETKMNRHLRYAQAVPGRNVGRGAGIIETHNLPELIDAVGLWIGSKRTSSGSSIAPKEKRSPRPRTTTAAGTTSKWLPMLSSLDVTNWQKRSWANSHPGASPSRSQRTAASNTSWHARRRGTIQFSILKRSSTPHLSQTNSESICGDMRHRTNATHSKRWIGCYPLRSARKSGPTNRSHIFSRKYSRRCCAAPQFVTTNRRTRMQ